MFQPGQIIKTFTSKKGNLVILRLAKKENLQAMTEYINELSREDTFISFSGEQITLDEERKYLDDLLLKTEKGNAGELIAVINDNIIGICGFTRKEKRSLHFAEMGISIKKEYRAEGIGKEMMRSLLDLAKQMEIQYMQLSCFANNEVACSLYKKFGFEQVGKIPNKFLYKGDYVDELVFFKEL